MKAINLIPADERRGAGGAAGRTGGVAYAIVGVLALALLMFGAWTLTNKQIKERTAEAASLEQQAQQRTAQASALGPYAKFAELRTNRVQTVKQLLNSRFDWAHAFGEVSRVLPANTWLTAMTATIAPGVGSDVGGTTDPLRTARPLPAIEMAGCATSQIAVSQLIGRLKLINGVEGVSISTAKSSTTEKPDPKNSGQTDSAAPTSDQKYVRKDPCTENRPTFSLVVFFKGLINPPGQSGKPELSQQTGPSTVATTGAAPAPGATTAAGGASTTPTTPTTTAAPAGGTQ